MLDFDGLDLVWPTSFICSWKPEAVRDKELQKKLLGSSCPAENRVFPRETGNRVVAGRYRRVWGAQIISVRDLYLQIMFGLEKKYSWTIVWPSYYKIVDKEEERGCICVFVTYWSLDHPAIFSSVRTSIHHCEIERHVTWCLPSWSEEMHCLAMLSGSSRGWRQDTMSFSPTAPCHSRRKLSPDHCTSMTDLYSLCELTHVWAQTHQCCMGRGVKCERPCRGLTSKVHTVFSDLSSQWLMPDLKIVVVSVRTSYEHCDSQEVGNGCRC